MSGSGTKINSAWFRNRKNRGQQDSYDLLRKALTPAQGNIQQTVYNDWVFPLTNYVTGSLSATESADTFAASGSVISSGSLAATETADTFAGSGTAGVIGSLATTESADTFAASGGIVATGTLSATEQSDAFSASGGIIATGTLAATEQADTFAGTALASAFGALAVTEPADVFTGAGSVVGAGITGSMAATEARDVFSGSGGNAPIIVIDTHDGFDQREKFKEEVAAKERKKNELRAIYEQIAEHRPAVKEIVKEFAQETELPVIPSPSINFDRLLESLNAMQQLQAEYAEHDDEEALMMMI